MAGRIIGEPGTLEELRSQLGRPTSGRAIVLIGGADGLDTEQLGDLRQFFASLAEHLDATGTAVVDGGTDAGVMRLIADAHAAAGATSPLLGVVPRGVLSRTTRNGSPITIAPGHDVLLVPGDHFGDESTWLFAAADHIAGGAAATVVVNGGRLTLDEAAKRLAAGGPVVAVEGSGRAADELAADASWRGRGDLRVISIEAEAGAIAAALAPAAATAAPAASAAAPVAAAAAPAVDRPARGSFATSGRREETMASTSAGGPRPMEAPRSTEAPRPAEPRSADRLESALDALELSPARKEMLRHRWLDQVGWMTRQARRMRSRFYFLRLPVVIGGVAVPGLVSVSLTTAETGEIPVLRTITFAISLMVAGFAALEAIFQYGDRWRLYRRTAERLKSTGWQYLMLVGGFRRYATHEAAFAPFAEQVEQILGEDVEGYLEQVMPGDGGGSGAGGYAS